MEISKLRRKPCSRRGKERERVIPLIILFVCRNGPRQKPEPVGPTKGSKYGMIKRDKDGNDDLWIKKGIVEQEQG